MYSVSYDGTLENVIEERWYTYDAIGNADHVIRRIEGDVDASGNQWYRGTRLIYTKGGHLWIARSERWQLDEENGNQAFQCEPLAAMEYRCDSGRQRYLVRPRDRNDDFALVTGAPGPDPFALICGIPAYFGTPGDD